MQKDIQINSGNLILRGMLHVPDQIDGKIPAVIILHGFGGNKMGPGFMFVRLSRILEEHNIASIRFDFAGSGESDGDFKAMTLSGEVQDALNIYEYLSSLEFIDTENIGLLGFSMGGAVASITAGKLSDKIKSLCLWAPAGNMRDIVMNDFIGNGYSDFIKNGYYGYEGLLMGRNFVEELTGIDIYREASQYKGNVLLLHGSADEVVSINASYDYIKKSYDNNTKLIVIDNADHMFSNYFWAQDMIMHTTEFMKKQLKKEEILSTECLV